MNNVVRITFKILNHYIYRNAYVSIYLLATKCPDECTNEDSDVCGTDGIVYHNECLLNHAACTQNKDIKVAHYGYCDNNKGKTKDNNNDETDAHSAEFFVETVFGFQKVMA